MAESKAGRKVTEETAPESNASAAHASAGLLQPGEAGDVLTTRVPRGVGEPAADADAEGYAGIAALQSAVKEQVEAESAQGFRGVQVDSTPNENYTLRGVGRGLPTPETVVHTPKGR